MRRAVFTSAGVLCLLAGGVHAGEAERVAAANAMETLYDAERYAEALDACELLIEYTRDEFGDKSPELIDPLTYHGNIQRRLNRPERALESYEQAALLIEMNESVFSDRLVELLRKIAGAYQDAQKVEDSAAALQRAKVITHRNYGILNLQQLPLLDDLTAVYASHDLLAANREQLFALRVNERRYGADNPDVVPGLYHLADWFRRTRQFGAARSLYRRAVTILEEAYGASDLRLVPALTGIADTYRAERSFRGEGRESLERALHVYETTEYPDQQDHAMALIQLGDWYILTNKREEAIETYSRAWQVLSQDGQSIEVAQKQLGKPTRLRYEHPAPEVDMVTASSREPLFVDLLFTVKADGTVDEAVVVDSNASNSVKRHVRLAVQQARYRPGFEEGKPVPMQVRLRQKYYSGDGSPPAGQAATPDPEAGVPSQATTPGEAGAATGTGAGVPAAPAASPEGAGDVEGPGEAEGQDESRGEAEAGGETAMPPETQAPGAAGETLPEDASAPTPPAEPAPESP